VRSDGLMVWWSDGLVGLVGWWSVRSGRCGV